jgi:hypothetical protein
MKRQHRNEQAATLYARRLYLGRCFSAWQSWTRRHLKKQELRKLMEQHQQKMSALLEAAATGALWSGNKSESLDDSHLSSDSDQSQQDNMKTSAPKKTTQHQQHPDSLPPRPPTQTQEVHLVTTKKAREHLIKVLGGDGDAIRKATNQQQSHYRVRKNSIPRSVEATDAKEMNDEEQVSVAEVPGAAMPVLPKHLPLDKVLAGPKKTNRVMRKPIKAVGPVGMADRAAQMAERKEARIKRMRELEEEKLVITHTLSFLCLSLSMGV